MSATPNPMVSIRYRNVAVTNTKILVRAGNTAIYGWTINNPNGTEAFVNLFDAAATADVTLGVTTPDISIAVPPDGAVVLRNERGCGDAFLLGLVIAACTTETGAVAPVTALSVALNII